MHTATRTIPIVLGCFLLGTSAQGAPGDTRLVSISMSGAPSGDAWIPEPSAAVVSADGRYVAFSSSQATLVPGDTNGNWDVFVRDRASGATERVSVDTTGRQGNGRSENAAISADGRFVVFQSSATNLAGDDRADTIDIFVRDRHDKITRRLNAPGGVPMNASSRMPAISGDGRYVSFLSDATNLVAGDTNGLRDLYVQNLLTGVTQRASVNTTGVQGDRAVGYHTLNGDGSLVVFDSAATTLVANDANGVRDVFVHDLRSRTTERVSVSSTGVEGDRASSAPTITADGRYVAFWSGARTLAPGRTLRHAAVYLRDLHAQTTELIGTRPDGAQIPAVTAWPSISNDGRYVVFEFYDAGPWQVMLRDRWRDSLEWVSTYPSGFLGNSDSYRPRISGDGSTVVFGSASRLVPETSCGDEWACNEVYAYEVGRPAAVFTLSPRSLGFGEQAVGTATTRNFSLRNTGTTPVNVRSISVRGADRRMFSLSHDCGAQVAAGAGCAIKLTFRPTSAGDMTARLRLETDVYELRVRTITGTGVEL